MLNGFSAYLRANPLVITLTTTLPRATMQVVFFTLLGSVTLQSADSEYSFVGSVAIAILLSTVIQISDVPADEKWQGTFYRLRTSAVSPVALIYLRAIPYVVEGLFVGCISWVVAGAVTGNAELIPKLLPLFPILLLVSITSGLAGLALASPVLGKRADVVVSNGAVYLIIVAGGLIVPNTDLPMLSVIGKVLPATNGLQAARGILAGEPGWSGSLWLELIVGLGWGLVGAALYWNQVRKAHKNGTDDFA
ncbi:ABC transporter permease [Arthrobacter sp. GAS37]|uniref:ABC transporter permease n=1 Tax=Arthrobacter sp. GAS37 TaxID=3156261 RepID=UPI00384EF639